jgi:elongation factor Ts
MAAITAAMVNELRSKTGLGMMECKKALTEADGDVQKAIDNLRKKGVKASIAERQASEGRAFAGASADGKVGAAVVVNCNTDFTAKSEPVQKILQTAVQKLLANPSADIASDPEVQAAITATAQQTGENVQIGKASVLSNPSGKIGTYVYSITGKIAVLMNFSGDPGPELIQQIGGHIAFARPVGLTRDEVPQDLVAKEREIAVEQAKATGKPQQIAEKIAEGKLNAFFAERVLLDQEFFNAQVFKGSVGNMLKEKGVKLEQYVRLEVGQS